MAELTLQLVKGDKVDPRVEYRDALSQNVTPIIRKIFDVGGYMYQQPGLSAFGTATGIDRGGVWNERLQNHFRVSGGSFVEISAAGVYNLLGTIPNSDLVSLPYSFNTQGIVADERFFLYDPTNGFREVVDVDLGNPIDAVWVDGYYFFTDGEFIYHTELQNEESIDPLKFATSEFSPDPSLGLGLTTDNKVIVFNRYTIEYFANQASDQFAFTRLSARAIKYGLVGTHCKCEIAGQFFFVGGPKEGDLSVYALGVGEAIEIATREVTELLGEYSEADLSACVMESRIVDGYPGLVLHLPDVTLFYNVKVGRAAGPDAAWSTLTSVGGTQWRAIHGVFEPRVGEWIYGDRATNRLGRLDPLVATQYDELVECLLFTPFVQIETASIDELQIETIPGFNVSDDASVFISFSYDGVIYSAEELIPYGQPGRYGARFIQYRLGYVDNYFTMRLRWVSTSRMCFSQAKMLYG